MNYINKTGLLETKPDGRDFKLGKIIKWIDLKDLPENFELEPISIKNQGDTDFCTAFATCGMSEIQEEVELNPYWSFAAGKEISGNPEKWGQDIRTALKAHLEPYGAVEEKEIDYWRKNDFKGETNILRYIENYPKEMLEKAKEHRKQSFFKVEGYPREWTPSDAIRSAMYLFRDKKRAVGIGVKWNYKLSDTFITEPSDDGFGHMMYIRGWKKHMFIVQNSYGKEAGENGTHYFSEEVINKTVKKYGAYLFVDEDPEEMKKVCWSFWRYWLNKLKKL